MSILITPYVYLNKYKKICFSINKEWSDLANKINKNIIMICDYSNFKNILKRSKIQAVVLSGGGDIFKVKKNKLNELRDKFEINLANYCFKRKIPVIAVCRGFQLLASNSGCKIIKSKQDSNIHKITLKIDGEKKSIFVNSYHKYKIFDIGSDFDILGKCKDNSVEIASHKKKRLLCLMMHPERPGNNKIILNLFNKFIN